MALNSAAPPPRPVGVEKPPEVPWLPPKTVKPPLKMSSPHYIPHLCVVEIAVIGEEDTLNGNGCQCIFLDETELFPVYGKGLLPTCK